MDNRSKVIGAATVVAVVVGIVVIVALLNRGGKCPLLNEKPVADTTVPILANADNSLLARFAAHLEYPQQDKKTKFVKLLPSSVTSSGKTNMVIEAECGTLTLTLAEDATTGSHYATGVTVVARGGGTEKTCSLKSGKYFEAHRGSRYQCEKPISYDCQDDKAATVLALVINVIEFDMGAKKNSTAWDPNQKPTVCT